MLINYYVNTIAQTTGEHEVHTENCRYLPDVTNRIYLGMFNSPIEALEEARKYYPLVDGCYYCCYPAHTK